ncbi:uncharacterized protein PHACADRAFT_249714 [Phanerochaete carnosa HHB-10118-sp]|uniref:Mid2 domain-containing protein n=1 Tax=Phanerochaete carnosa (strain HHB-10118-sp) TaxID=650164 RepID=K5W5X8_PHACS|nr:uncharacterized protein PHACADRAFT_249714 [Phanerochaete carnosa HHB-10118-sp]EKM59308.1 hypothetical protein PHACADRAFT_249714 [Phanerochaete carnosa HHB-10118-sp]
MALVLGMLCMSVQFALGQMANVASPSAEFEVLAKTQDSPDVLDAITSSAPVSSIEDVPSTSSTRSFSSTSKSRASLSKPTPAAGAAADSGSSLSQQPQAVTLNRTSTSHSVQRPLPTAPSPESFPHTQPLPPQHPQPVRHPHQPPARHSSNKSGLIVGIVFGVLGGIVGCFVLFALGRCVNSWRRTPSRDRVRSVVDRHYLEQEMQEREREDIERRVRAAIHFRRPKPPPPPPYQHAPAYDQVVAAPEACREPTPPPPPTPTEYSPPTVAPPHSPS